MGGRTVSELRPTLQRMRELPSHALIESNGRWRFVGRVNIEMAYCRKDGQPATVEDYANACRFGPRLAGMTTRTWDSEEAARAALAEAS